LASLDGPAYIERVALSSPEAVRAAGRAVRKAFITQLEHNGYALVEFLSPCPTYWRMSPLEALRFIENEMVKVFPLGVFRDWESATRNSERETRNAKRET